MEYKLFNNLKYASDAKSCNILLNTTRSVSCEIIFFLSMIDKS